MANNKTKFLVLISTFTVLFNACSTNQEVQISGNIDYLGDVEFYVESVPLHYKYSEKEQYPIEVNSNTFNINLPFNTPQIVNLVIQDQKYPIYIEPNNPTNLSIRRSSFPLDVEVVGPGSKANDSYQSFLRETIGLQSAITAEMNKFKVGEENEAVNLSAKKVEIAKKNLSGTKLNDIYLKTIGEDFIINLRAVEYSARHYEAYDTDIERKRILDEAVSNNFFSYESLKAQRAGIRDFTHYYARTFGIYDEVNERFGKTLAEYDIKRVAYEELNEKRLEVIEVITDPKAKSYAQLFLVAERIGEIPIELAEPSYQDYIADNSVYPEFVEFITWFHDEIKSVSPGEPAIPFSLFDSNGNVYSMDDFSGKFVLLDFWAGWCQPCLEEFPIMRDIYSNYSRDELEIVGISTEIDSLVWQQDLQRFKNPWVQLYGGKGFDQETFKAYKGGGIPFYILVDPDGKIARYNDMRPSFNFTEVLDSLLLHQENQKITP